MTTENNGSTQGASSLHSLVSRALVWMLLRVNGWKRAKLHDGSPGWETVEGNFTFRGSWKYALSRLRG